ALRSRHSFLHDALPISVAFGVVRRGHVRVAATVAEVSRSRRGSCAARLLDPAEKDAAVVAAEAHRIRERDLDLRLARLVRHVVRSEEHTSELQSLAYLV